mgnify:CR=1 FL=1
MRVLLHGRWDPLAEPRHEDRDDTGDVTGVAAGSTYGEAFIVGLLTALHPQMLEWGQRYWGGSLATLGGARAPVGCGS